MQGLKSIKNQLVSSINRHHELMTVLGLVFIVKIIIFLYGAISYEIFSNKHFNSINSFFSIWNQWDSLNYLNIAENGYAAHPRKGFLLAFFPLYPWLIKTFAILTKNYFLSAMLISTLASFAAAVLLYKLAKRDYSEEESRLSVWFLLIFPTAYFLHVGYSESLFLVLTLSCFILARRGKWLWVTFFGVLAFLTRNSGICLIPAMAVEAYLQYRNNGKWRWQWFTLIFILLPIVVLFYISYKTVGDPFGFFISQRVYWGKQLTVPWVAIVTKIKDTAVWFNWKNPTESAIELGFAGVALAVTLLGLKKIRASYAVWIFTNLLLFVSTRFMQSIPRYILVLFPIYFIFTKWSKNIQAYFAITLICILFLSFFTMLFVQGFWAF